jgi:hypothetical protein
MGIHKIVSLKKEADKYWKGHWKVGEEIDAGIDLDNTKGRGKIVHVYKRNPDWAKVKLESGKMFKAHKQGSYRLV